MQAVLTSLASRPQLAELSLLQLHLHCSFDVMSAFVGFAVRAHRSFLQRTLTVHTRVLSLHKLPNPRVLNHHHLLHVHMLAFEQLIQRVILQNSENPLDGTPQLMFQIPIHIDLEVVFEHINRIFALRVRLGSFVFFNNHIRNAISHFRSTSRIALRHSFRQFHMCSFRFVSFSIIIRFLSQRLRDYQQ